MPISAYDEEKQVAGGRPDIQKLIKMGMLKPEDIDPITGQRKGAQSKYVIQTQRVKNPETGKYEMIELKVNIGHVENPDCKGWRIGLTPEKYWKMLEEQHHNHTFRNRKDTYAPELTAEEANLFSKWLDDNIEVVEDKEDDEVPKHPVVRAKSKAIKKAVAKKAEGKSSDTGKTSESTEEVPKKVGRPKSPTSDE